MQLESLNIGETNAEGTLDALANCKNLTSVNCYNCRSLEGPCPHPRPRNRQLEALTAETIKAN